jgi:hypothetical protein
VAVKQVLDLGVAVLLMVEAVALGLMELIMQAVVVAVLTTQVGVLAVSEAVVEVEEMILENQPLQAQQTQAAAAAVEVRVHLADLA